MENLLKTIEKKTIKIYFFLYRNNFFNQYQNLQRMRCKNIYINLRLVMKNMPFEKKKKFFKSYTIPQSINVTSVFDQHIGGFDVKLVA